MGTLPLLQDQPLPLVFMGVFLEVLWLTMPKVVLSRGDNDQGPVSASVSLGS